MLHKVTGRDGDDLIVTPDRGTGEAVAGESMYVGKEVISFPFVGGWLRWVLEGRVWIVVVAGLALVVVGYLPWGGGRNQRQVGERREIAVAGTRYVGLSLAVLLSQYQQVTAVWM